MATRTMPLPDAGERLVLSAPGFVGRERELAVLGDALARPPAVVLVEGEAGIGKSRLIQEFLASPAAGEQRCLLAACPPFREPLTLGAIVDAVREATENVRGLPLTGLAGALRPLFPEWADDLPLAPDPAEDAKAARHRLFRALVELLGCLGVRVLVVEDVHWADEATLEFLLFVTSRRPQPMSLVVSYRPEDVPADSLLLRLSSRLPAGTTQARLTVGPLDVSGTARLVSSMLAGEQLSNDFAAFLHRHTEGVPLAVEESVRVMHERADLARRSDGEWVRRHLEWIDVPPTVRDAVLERVWRLEPGAQAVLRAVAVLAEPTEEATVLAVAGLPADAGRAGLDDARGCGLLQEDARGQVSFRHVLAARAIHEAIPVSERRVLHTRAGETLEDRPLPVARLARHFREAGDTVRWCRYAEQAADLAFASGDEATAAVLLHDLVVGAGLSAEGVVRLANKIPLTSFTEKVRCRDLVGALRSILDAGDLEPREEADLRCQIGRVLVSMEEWNQARVQLELAIPGLAHDPVAAARAMTLLGWPIGTDCPVTEHLRWLRRAATVTASRDPVERLLMLVNRVTALLMLGDEEGWLEAARLPGEVPAGWERIELSRGQSNIGELAMMWGRYDEARRRLTQAWQLTSSNRYVRIGNAVLAIQAHLDWFTGTWEGLAGRAETLAGNDEATPETRLEAALVSGLLRGATGSGERAAETLQTVLAEMGERGAVSYVMEPAAALARLRLDDGGAEEALHVTDGPFGLVAKKGLWVWATDLAPTRVDALVASGRTDEARQLVAAFARGLRGRDTPAPKAALVLCRAILTVGTGDVTRAAAQFARAAKAWDALPRPYDGLLARKRQARCLIEVGRSDDGIALLTLVAKGLSDLGARADADRVLRTLRQNGVRVHRPGAGRPGYGNQLSPRELEVVRLLVTGQKNREIAASMHVSPKTVAYHLDSAKRKLHAHSRTSLVLAAVDAGLVSGQPPANQ